MPSPLPQSSPPQAPETTASAIFVEDMSVVCGAGKCRPEHPLCNSHNISRLQRRCSESILPPYAAPLLGRSVSLLLFLRRLRQKSKASPLLGTASPWLSRAAIPPHLCRGKPRQKCSGQPGGSRSGCWHSVCQDKPATPCAGRTVPGLRPQPLYPQRTLYWAVPAQGGEAVCLPLDAGLFRSAVGPHSVPPMHPLQSPSSPTRQTASPPTLRFAPCPMALPDS